MCRGFPTRASAPRFSREAFERLEGIYREVDAAVAEFGPRCDLSGRCCDFERSGHVLYATDLEAHYLLDRARRETDDASRFAPDGRLCPFWRKPLCAARAGRPLGCRVYFCDPAFAQRMPEVYERFQTAIRGLHDALGLEYNYAPLVETLHALGGDSASVADRLHG